MRQQSRFVVHSFAVFLVIMWAGVSHSQTRDKAKPDAPKPPYARGNDEVVANAPDECFSTAHRYATKACRITILRDVPGSPLPVVGPKGTTVQIRVLDRKNLETIQFVQASDAAPPPDFGLAIIKASSLGLSTAAFQTKQPEETFIAHLDIGLTDTQKLAINLALAESQLIGSLTALTA